MKIEQMYLSILVQPRGYYSKSGYKQVNQVEKIRLIIQILNHTSFALC